MRSFKSTTSAYLKVLQRALSLWATLYPVEITGGQNFGEAQAMECHSNRLSHVASSRMGSRYAELLGPAIGVFPLSPSIVANVPALGEPGVRRKHGQKRTYVCPEGIGLI